MRLMLSTGVILTTDNMDIAQQYLKNGAVEYNDTPKKPVEKITQTNTEDNKPKQRQVRKKSE